MQYMQHDLARLQARGEAMAEQQNRTDTRVEAVRQDLRRQQQEVERLSREIAELRAERERLRQDIVADLSERMSRLMAAQTPPSAPAARAQAGYEHSVERGQTLSDIARAYGVSVDAILQANNLTNPDRIREGQKLFIPE